MKANTPGARAFPWDEVMGFAFGVLRLSPPVFWAMTPRELALAMRPRLAGAEVPTRDQFERMLRQFPDAVTGNPAHE